jgi:elongation factor 3
MMDGTIGSLSGGWQMKLRLVRAVLIDADILLLDEPTNHLDKGTVKWLTDYLLNLHDTTVITVSHGMFLIDFIFSTALPSVYTILTSRHFLRSPCRHSIYGRHLYGYHSL